MYKTSLEGFRKLGIVTPPREKLGFCIAYFELYGLLYLANVVTCTYVAYF